MGRHLAVGTRQGTLHCWDQPFKNSSRRGWGDTWLLGPGKVHSIAGTGPCKNLSRRDGETLGCWDLVRYTLSSGPGKVHSVIRTRNESLVHLVIGAGPNSPVQDASFCNFVTRWDGRKWLRWKKSGEFFCCRFCNKIRSQGAVPIGKCTVGPTFPAIVRRGVCKIFLARAPNPSNEHNIQIDEKAKVEWKVTNVFLPFRTRIDNGTNEKEVFVKVVFMHILDIWYLSI